ncbi:putative porin [Pedobacter insulae]|uniref:Putative porin n=1 Tax=Pedobacter insulae TaxID=414048 RepID=A0A1I2W0N0_9SPHI|nr:putative porin [Pedobacter insulae]SFG94940.1 Putative porin [Pedobacter insulae]
MYRIIILFTFFSLFFCGSNAAFSQDLKTTINANKKQQDSIRKALDGEKDSVVFTAKYVRYTTLKLTKDSIQTIPLDTSLVGIQNFSPLFQPRNPTVGTGNLGLAATSLLFNPHKTIGFDAGFHSFDYYVLNHDDVKFYKARSPFTSLYYVSGGEKEQMLKLTHSQNIKKNWNFGANFNRIGANGVYSRQRGDHLNAAIFTWYESPNNRYNLWVDGVFNTLKAQENGSIVNTNIFEPNGNRLVDKLAESVRLYTAKQLWRKNAFLMKQSYFVGRIDSTGKSSAQNILPTNKISHTFIFDNSSYSFKKDQVEENSSAVLPVETAYDPAFTNDSTNVKHIQNEFIYSFFLRAKGSSVIKNELKIDAGIRHDFYNYEQYNVRKSGENDYFDRFSFQNVTLLGVLGYRFSNRINLDLNVQQIFQGRNIGDFLYEAKSKLLFSEKAGRIVMGAYLQNKSPEQIFTEYKGNHYQWAPQDNNFDRTKIANFTFSYLNDVLKLDASAAYYLVNNYLYFKEDPSKAKAIIPAQESSAINLLKVSVGKRFVFRSYHLDAYVVYQKTDSKDLLRTPEVYTFNSLYKDQTFFKVLKTQIGFDVRYNTTYTSLSYSPAASQFYNTTSPTFGSKPVIDIWVKAGLRRANLFVKYDYINQKLFSNGFYTVNDYPMQDKLLKFGVSWNFYD